jgi:hypothetical protein
MDIVGCTGEVEEENRTKCRIDGTLEGRGFEESLRDIDKMKNKLKKTEDILRRSFGKGRICGTSRRKREL